MDAAVVLLPDALKNPLGAGTLDPHRHAGIFGLEQFSQPLGHVELDRRVVIDLAFFPRGLDQFRRDGDRRRRSRFERLGEKRGGH